MALAMETNTSKEYYENRTLYELEQDIITFNKIVEKRNKEMEKEKNKVQSQGR